MFAKALMRSMLAVGVVAFALTAQAVIIDLVPVGNAGNAADSTGYGTVTTAYAIGKYEITAGQYCEFLNAVAKADPYGLYDTNMDTDSWGCQITRQGVSDSYTYDFSGRPSGAESDWINRPVNYVCWGDAARFVNWLHNGQPTGPQGPTTTEDGAYYLNGAVTTTALMAVTRKPDAKWWIPSEDEWYKAAYHDKTAGLAGIYFDYPTGANSAPSNLLTSPDPGNNANFDDGAETIGSPFYRTEAGAFANSDSPYGTFDQGGNVWEWNETAVTGSTRGRRGGSFFPHLGYLAASSRADYNPVSTYGTIGFRVASVPEPGAFAMLVAGTLAGLMCWRRRR